MFQSSLIRINIDNVKIRVETKMQLSIGGKNAPDMTPLQQERPGQSPVNRYSQEGQTCGRWFWGRRCGWPGGRGWRIIELFPQKIVIKLSKRYRISDPDPQSPVTSTAYRGRPVDGGFEGGGVGDKTVGDGYQLKHSPIVVWPATKIYHIEAPILVANLRKRKI